MQEVKLRINLVRSVVDGSVTTGREDFDGELVFVHLRKTLELVAFASLSANKAKYSVAHENFATHWNAKRMLSSLEKINPDFFPIPVQEASPKKDGVRHFELLSEGFLTKNEFVVLYDKCGEILHARNPFTARDSVIQLGYSVSDWGLRIQRLLSLHRVHLVDSPNIWLVSMKDPSDGKVHAYIAEPSEAEL
jgi:hypothetical protein